MADWRKFEIGGMYCPHCKSLLSPGIINIDTGVFKGTKLDSFEEKVVWKCPVCSLDKQNLSHLYQQEKCMLCKSLCITSNAALNLPSLAIFLDEVNYREGVPTEKVSCTSCTKCEYCGNILGRDFLYAQVLSIQQRRDGSGRTARWSSMGGIFTRVHYNCRIPFERRHEQQLAESVKKNEQEWTKYLISSGQCLICERPLSAWDKIAGRTKHSSC